MLAGFQISHSDGLKGSSHNHHIFYVHQYWVPVHVVKKEHYLTNRSDVILRSQNAQNSKFSGALPRTPLGELTVIAYIAPSRPQTS